MGFLGGGGVEGFSFDMYRSIQQQSLYFSIYYLLARIEKDIDFISNADAIQVNVQKVSRRF